MPRVRPSSPRRTAAVVAVFACVGSASAQTSGAEVTAPDLTPLASRDPFQAAIAYPELEAFAPRHLPGAKRAVDRDPTDAQAPDPGMLQGAGLSAWPRLYRDRVLVVTSSVTTSVGAFKIWNNQFAPPPTLAVPAIPANPGWGEFFVDAALSARRTLSSSLEVYGDASYLESGTRGRDYADNANIWHGDPELLRAGMTWKRGLATVDLSYGQQDFMIGNGMLLWEGATNGTQRGADYLAPRTAWSRAAIARVTSPDITIEAFDLAPNESPAEETNTRIVGLNVEWKQAGPLRLGGTYLYVPRSAIVTRDGMSVYDLRARWHPLASEPEFWLQGELAWERSALTRASGAYVQANYNAQRLPWKPLVSLQYSRLSGDEPGTTRWEGFDPLYYGNGNPNWYPGKVAATFLNNTNLAVGGLNVTLTPSDRNILELWVLAFRAVTVNAPMVIPDPSSPPPIGGGVPSHYLATEVDVAWTIKVNNAFNINLMTGWATPGAGYRDLYAASGGRAVASWLVGAQFNLSF